MMGKEFSEQTIYKLLREFDSTILEKFGFGSCNISLKAQVGFMIGFISLIPNGRSPLLPLPSADSSDSIHHKGHMYPKTGSTKGGTQWETKAAKRTKTRTGNRRRSNRQKMQERRRTNNRKARRNSEQDLIAQLRSGYQPPVKQVRGVKPHPITK